MAITGIVKSVVPTSLGGTLDEGGLSDEQKAALKQQLAAQRGMKKGGMVKSSVSKRADGCCVKGKTKGRMV